jgi:protein TonB
MHPSKAPTRRKEARQPGADSPRMRRYTLFSLGIHVLVLTFVSLPWTQRERPIFADPLYEVALIQWPEPNYEPPRPALRKEPEPERKAKPKPKPKPKPETVALEAKTKTPEKAEPEPPPAEEPVSLGQVDQRDFTQDWYLQLIKARLARAWDPPSGGEGMMQASLHFIIRGDGSIGEPEVRSSSGWTLYDRSTLRAVMSVKKFPPLPESYSGDQLGLTVNFKRMLEGSS